MADFRITARVTGVAEKTRRGGGVIPDCFNISVADVQGDADPGSRPVGFWAKDQSGVPNPGFDILKQAEGSDRRVVIEGYTDERTNYGRTTVYFNGQAASWADPSEAQAVPAQDNGQGSWSANKAQRAYYSIMDELPVGRDHLIESMWALKTILQAAQGTAALKDLSKNPLPSWVYERAADLIAVARTLAVEMASRDMADDQSEPERWPEAGAQPDPQPQPAQQGDTGSWSTGPKADEQPAQT